jgi:pimeloyl-ACP methyl ester carboxylesterase
MAMVRVGALDFGYDTFGDGAPMLLIMGLGTQRIAWQDRFCERLAAHGFRVVRFDNRDVGESSRATAPYRLEDMADDAAGLLETLAMPSAHVVGASLGGFIAQTLALRHRARVRSLCSIMSSTGDRAVGQPRADILQRMMTPMPGDRDGYIAVRLQTARLIASPGFPFDEPRVRNLLERQWERGFDPQGVMRQLQAAITGSDRTAALRDLDLPTVVIHGLQDPVVGASGGEATARAIPGARWVPIPGMGHDVPEGAWDTVIGAIVENAARAA